MIIYSKHVDLNVVTNIWF